MFRSQFDLSARKTTLVNFIILGIVVSLQFGCKKNHADLVSPHILTGPAHLTIASGNNQHVVVGGSMLEPMAVLLTDSANYPIPGKQIKFTVTRGNGQVLKPVSGNDINELLTPTDNYGKAYAQFQYFGNTDNVPPYVVASVTSVPSLSVEFHLLLP
jgi:hypothetical protein